MEGSGNPEIPSPAHPADDPDIVITRTEFVEPGRPTVLARCSAKEELLERRISSSLEEMIEQRKSYVHAPGQEKKFQPVEGVDKWALVQYPIIAAGDVCGAIMFLAGDDNAAPTEAEDKLIQTAASFLGKQMEE